MVGSGTGAMMRVDTAAVKTGDKIVIGNDSYTVVNRAHGGVLYNWLSTDGTTRAGGFTTDEGFDSDYYLFDGVDTYTLCDGNHDE